MDAFAIHSAIPIPVLAKRGSCERNSTAQATRTFPLCRLPRRWLERQPPLGRMNLQLSAGPRNADKSSIAELSHKEKTSEQGAIGS
jgi:hypothetical protein